jgi:hypothetical protein
MQGDNHGIIADRPREAAAARAGRWMFAAAIAIGAAAAAYYASRDLTLSHYDARAHLVVARRVVDSLTPGWRQLGGVWLPLPHLLLLLPALNDWAFRTGAPGVALSIGALAWGLAALARWIARASGSIAVALIAPLIVLLNPNVLYLQSTPMTEGLLYGLSLVALTRVDAWIADPTPTRARGAGWILAALVLTRYEGWLVAAALGGVSLLALWRQPWRVVLAPWWPPAIAVLGFFAVSWGSTGHLLVTSGFYIPNNPSRHDPVAALREVITTTATLGGGVLIALAAAGLAVTLWRARGEPRALAPLALLAAGVLPLGAFFDGHPLRVRYMIALVLAEGVLAAIGLASLPRRARLPAAAAALAVIAIARPPIDAAAPMVVEAQRDQPNRAGRRAVTNYLRYAYDGQPILASMGSLGHYMQETAAIGIPLRAYVHEGTGDLWMSAHASPSRYVQWIMIEEVAEGGDELSRDAKTNPAFLDGFSRVAEGGGVALYRRGDEGRVTR